MIVKINNKESKKLFFYICGENDTNYNKIQIKYNISFEQEMMYYYDFEKNIFVKFPNFIIEDNNSPDTEFYNKESNEWLSFSYIYKDVETQFIRFFDILSKLKNIFISEINVNSGYNGEFNNFEIVLKF